MCLSRLDNKTKVRGIGWKVVKVTNGEHGTVYSSILSHGPVRYYGAYYTIGETIHDGRPAHRKIITDKDEKYTTGFHIFRTRRGAVGYAEGCHRVDFKIARVQYSRVVASGVQRTWGRKRAGVVVARTFKIIEIEGA